MFGNIQTVMIVKSDGREAQYAQLLFQLISKLPNFESSQPVTEAEYKTSALSVDNIPNGKVIFFGNGKESMIQGRSVNWQYDCFGMKYGWLGNRCVITADPAGISLGEQNAFAEYYNSRIEDFRQILKLQHIHYSKTRFSNIDQISDGTKKQEINYVQLMKEITEETFPLFAKAVGSIIDMHATFERADIWKHQYELLVCEYIINGFARFMNSNSEKVGRRKVIIVYDPKDTEYAHLLNNLIQQYSGYDVAEYTEKMFVDNAKSLSSKNKIIFLGKTKSSKERWLDINRYIYYKNGMRYGWSGNHAFIYAKPLKRSEVEAFKEEYCQKGNEFKDKAKKYKENGDVGLGVAGGLVVGLYGLPSFSLPTLIANVALYAVVAKVNEANQYAYLLEYQYQLLLREFVFNDFEKFMEEA